jgi:hypothetical protein
LREWARLGREHTDDEIVRQDLHGENVLVISAEVWAGVRDQ